MHLIIFILAELGHLDLAPLFRWLTDKQLPIKKSSLVTGLSQYEQELRKRLGNEWTAFYDRFLETQNAWCPLLFELDVEWEGVVDQHTVIPFYNKERIKPYGADSEPSEDHAKLYEVHIPAEFVKARDLDVTHLLQDGAIEGDQVRPAPLSAPHLGVAVLLISDISREHFMTADSTVSPSRNSHSPSNKAMTRKLRPSAPLGTRAA